jgi:hypothetical protein
MLRERMQGYGSGRTAQRIDDELARIAAGPEHDADPYVIRASSVRMY